MEPLTDIECPGCRNAFSAFAQLSHFRLFDVLGRGGMGSVFRAYDNRLGRNVAIKLLRKEHTTDTQYIQRLEREALSMAALRNPHVVQIYSTGWEFGRFFIAMELVEGGSLDDFLRTQKRMHEKDALSLAIQVVEGLRAAYQEGILHRDVKPANILFVDSHTVKITDFGISESATGYQEESNEILGTPYYISPERLSGSPEDHRSDMYSLGATLFHAIAGRPPFEAPDAVGVVMKHLNVTPLKVQTFASQVSGATTFIIDRCLKKNPEERYDTYEELLEHLCYARDECGLDSAEAKARNRVALESDTQQKRWAFAIASLLLVCLVGGGVALLMQQPAKTRTASAPAVASPGPFLSSAGPRLHSAREKLAAGHAAEAADDFNAIAAEPGSLPVDTAWAILQAGLAEMVADRMPLAKAQFKTLGSTGALLEKTAATKGMGAYFSKISALMLTDAKQRDLRMESDPAEEGPSSIPILLVATEEWQAGQIDEAVLHYRRFRDAKAPAAYAWIGDLRPIATNAIEEYTHSQMLIEQIRTADPEQKLDLAEALLKGPAPLASRAKAILPSLGVDLDRLQARRAHSIPEGSYMIVNAQTGTALNVMGDSIDPGAGIQFFETMPLWNEVWSLIWLDDGSYKLVSRHSKLALEYDNWLKQTGWVDRPQMKWSIESLSDGLVKISCRATRRALTAVRDGDKWAPGEDVYSGRQEQHWRLVSVPDK